VTVAVGVNLLWCVPGDVGGSEEYLTRQLLGLAGVDHEFEVVLFGLPQLAAAHPELAERYRIVAPRISGRSRAVRVGYESTWLGGQSRNRRLALVHHGGGTVPLVRVGTPLLTVHDLQYLAFPHYFGLHKLTYLRSAVPASVRRAAAITVPSRFVKGTVVEEFRYPADRVVVVPHGLDDRFGEAPVDEADLRRRYGLPGPYLVYPAITHRHKNHAVVVRALAELRRSRPELRLVLTGGKGLADDEVAADIDRLGLRDDVVRPGRVPDADRDALIRLAEALVFPSRYEGFGAPVLEAMRLGCPVLAADATALPEVVAGAGVLVDPDDPAAWADAVDRVLRDPLHRAELVVAGHERAGRFTAARSARALLGAYRLARS
jgi:glycosyltransferase involved in cell wall biosynthesis